MQERQGTGEERVRGRQGEGEGKACGRGAASKVGDESEKGLWRSHRQERVRQTQGIHEV